MDGEPGAQAPARKPAEAGAKLSQLIHAGALAGAQLRRAVGEVLKGHDPREQACLARACRVTTPQEHSDSIERLTEAGVGRAELQREVENLERRGHSRPRVRVAVVEADPRSKGGAPARAFGLTEAVDADPQVHTQWHRDSGGAVRPSLSGED